MPRNHSDQARPAEQRRREMTPVNRLDAGGASLIYAPHEDQAADEAFDLGDFEAELQRLAAANQELMDEFRGPADDVLPAGADDGELVRLRNENAELKARIEELEAAPPSPDEEQWLERQREY